MLGVLEATFLKKLVLDTFKHKAQYDSQKKTPPDSMTARFFLFFTSSLLFSSDLGCFTWNQVNHNNIWWAKVNKRDNKKVRAGDEYFAFAFFFASSEGGDFFFFPAVAAVLMAESEAAGFAEVGWKNRLMSCVGDNYNR